MTQQAKSGDTVKVHYTGSLDDDSVFDSSLDGDPLEFTIGDKQLIGPFEDAVVGMKPGDKKLIEVTPEDGYGIHHDDLVINMPRDNINDDTEPEIGMQVYLMAGEDQQIPAVIKEVSEESIQLDANHPLAGEILHFEIELISIV